MKEKHRDGSGEERWVKGNRYRVEREREWGDNFQYTKNKGFVFFFCTDNSNIINYMPKAHLSEKFNARN